MEDETNWMAAECFATALRGFAEHVASSIGRNDAVAAGNALVGVLSAAVEIRKLLLPIIAIDAKISDQETPPPERLQ